ncbi:MAG: hypothetical protein P8X97_03360 [Candidatus Bathyarchaeota archaeon]
MKESSIDKEFNPIIASIILIVVIIIGSIGIAIWVGSLTFGDTTKINFHAQIYSTNDNIGVLNERAIFDISIENYLNETRKFSVIVTAEEGQVYNENVELSGLEKRNIVVNQRLRFTGSWTIKIIEENKLWYNYLFTTFVTDEEADLEITRIDQINSNNNLISNLLIVAIIVIISGVVSFLFLKIRHKKQYEE